VFHAAEPTSHTFIASSTFTFSRATCIYSSTNFEPHSFRVCGLIGKDAPTLPDTGVRTQDVQRADASSSRAVSNSFCSANSLYCSIYTRYQISTAFKTGYVVWLEKTPRSHGASGAAIALPGRGDAGSSRPISKAFFRVPFLLLS
jgi:hypothetical protein